MLTETQRINDAAFVQPLLDSMTNTDPTDRPSAAEALATFQTMRKQMSELYLGRRAPSFDVPDWVVYVVIAGAYQYALEAWWKFWPSGNRPAPLD